MKTLLKYLAVAAAIAGLTQVANAVPQLRVFDGTTTITISDNGAGDTQGAAGQFDREGRLQRAALRRRGRLGGAQRSRSRALDGVRKPARRGR